MSVFLSEKLLLVLQPLSPIQEEADTAEDISLVIAENTAVHFQDFSGPNGSKKK